MPSARRVLALLLFAIVGCTSPTGPGDETGPAGTIYFAWYPDGASGHQVFSLELPDGEPQRLDLGSHSIMAVSVDRHSRGMVFVPAGFLLEYWPALDPGRAEYLAAGTIRSYPVISPDGNRIATIRKEQGEPDEVRVIDLSQHTEYTLGPLPSSDVWRIGQWFPAGDSLLVSREDSIGRTVYHVLHDPTGALTDYPFEATVAADEVEISPDGRWLALSRPGWVYTGKLLNVIRIYDMVTQELIREWKLPYDAGLLTWAPDSRYLLHAPYVHVSPDRPVLEVLDRVTGIRRALVRGATMASSLNWVE